MSVLNTNSLNTIDTKNLANETNLNNTTKVSVNQEQNENFTPKTITTTIMPAATNPMNATVTVVNSSKPFSISDQCSDTEEDSNRSTFAAQVYNKFKVSSMNSRSFEFPFLRRKSF